MIKITKDKDFSFSESHQWNLEANQIMQVVKCIPFNGSFQDLDFFKDKKENKRALKTYTSAEFVRNLEKGYFRNQGIIKPRSENKNFSSLRISQGHQIDSNKQFQHEHAAKEGQKRPENSATRVGKQFKLKMKITAPAFKLLLAEQKGQYLGIMENKRSKRQLFSKAKPMNEVNKRQSRINTEQSRSSLIHGCNKTSLYPTLATNCSLEEGGTHTARPTTPAKQAYTKQPDTTRGYSKSQNRSKADKVENSHILKAQNSTAHPLKLENEWLLKNKVTKIGRVSGRNLLEEKVSKDFTSLAFQHLLDGQRSPSKLLIGVQSEDKGLKLCFSQVQSTKRKIRSP